jgi:euchromatic histone-lysine N-methyltransferase
MSSPILIFFIYIYIYIDRLIEAKDVVFECGPNCGCDPGCVNRTSQKGLRHRLEVVFCVDFLTYFEY